MYHNYQATNIALPPIGGMEHPHLVCDRADIEALKGRIERGRPRALWRRLQANCDLYQDPDSPYCIDFEARNDGIEAGVTGCREIIVRGCGELALADFIDGGRSRGAYAARVLSALFRPEVVEGIWLEQKPANRELTSFGGVFEQDIPRGNMDMQLAIAYDLVAPFMDGDQRDVVRDYIFERAQICWDHRWRVPAGTNNRTYRFHMDPAAEALSLWGDRDNPFLAGYPAYVEPIIEGALDEEFYADGASVEGIGYGGCLSYVLTFAHMLNRKGIRHGLLDPRPMWKNLVLFYYLSRDPAHGAFSIAKFDQSKVQAPYHMWLQIARFFDVPMARWWWRRLFDARCEGPDLAGFEPMREQRVYLPIVMLFCDDDDPEASPKQLNLPASHHFRKRGLVVCRRDHDEDTPVFRLLAGPHSNRGTMQQWDALSISLTAFGQPLIVDPGRGSNNMTAHHSSILLDGKGQESLCGCGSSEQATAEQAAYHIAVRSRPALIQWHEQDGDLEYTMATAIHTLYGLSADGYGDRCSAAERHALVVHEGVTPFYVVTCDMFDYDDELGRTQPELSCLLIASKDTTLTTDDDGATIEGPRAALRVQVVTTEGVTVRQDRLEHTHHPRMICGRKGRSGRMLMVLTPLKPGLAAPEVERVTDTPEHTACIVRFGDHEDHITFVGPRDYIESDHPRRPGTGMRLKVERQAGGACRKRFTIPTLPGPHIVE